MAIAPVAMLGGVLLDAVEVDNPTHTYEVTEKAVEEGENVSDHVKEQPATLSVTGVIVGPDAGARLIQIQQLQDKRQLVTYVNRVIYQDMAIVSISTSHSVEIGNGFSFDIQMKRVRVAAPKQIQIVNVPPAVASKASETQNAGTKQTTATGKSANNKAADEKIADKIRNYQAAS